MSTPNSSSSSGGEPRMMTPVPPEGDEQPLSPSPSTESAGVSRIQPMSPSRRPQQQHPSVPSSPAPSAADRSPALTPTQQRINVFAAAAPTTPDPAEGVVLGLEQLERQQDEAERRKRMMASSAPSTSSRPPPSPQQQPLQSSSPPVMGNSLQQQQQQQVLSRRYLDDDTAPSSRDAASHTTGDGSLGSGDDGSSNNDSGAAKLSRIIKNTRKRLSSNDFLRRRSSGDIDDPAEDDEAEAADALIYGHLQKLGRNGKWQTRWFESDGQCLSYYKSSKRTKLLATLDLEKVGAIVIDEDDPKGCSFTIAVLGRPYYLRAESRASCKDWVITLNRVKEARLHQGNVKLIHQHKHILFRAPPDILSGSTSAYTQSIAVENAHRPRTHAVDESTIENIEEMMLKEETEAIADPALGTASYYETADSTETGSLGQVVLARWQKRKSSMSKLAGKLARWARSLKKYRCGDDDGVESNVRLDRHVHPPGHDVLPTNPVKNVVEPAAAPAISGWIGKETSLAAKAGPIAVDPDEAVVQGMDQVVADPVTHSASSGSSSVTPDVGDEEEEETRELS